MPSERVAMILKAKSGLSQEQIDRMTDREAWAWIYSQRPRKSAEKLDQICFTGFSVSRRKELEDMAEAAHLDVVTRVTKNLRYLCTGDNAGPSKMKEAMAKGVVIMSEQQFLNLIETGELPDD